MKKGNSSPGQHRRGRDKAPLTGRPRDSSGKGIKSHFHPFLAPSPGFSGCPCSLGRPADPARPFRPFRPKTKSTKGTQSRGGGKLAGKSRSESLRARIPPQPQTATIRSFCPPKKKPRREPRGPREKGTKSPKSSGLLTFNLALTSGSSPTFGAGKRARRWANTRPGPRGWGRANGEREERGG